MLYLIVVLSAAALSVLAQTAPYTLCTKGRATTYDMTGPSGACNFGNIGSAVNFGVPLASGIAIQEANWFNATSCGECYEVGGPNNTGVVQMIVQDMCLAQTNQQWCSGNDGIVHFDLLPNAFSPLADRSLGVIYTYYKKIPCPVPSGTNIGLFIVSGSNQYWIGVTAFNHRYGIIQIEFAENNQAFTVVARNSNNFFPWQGINGAIALPAQVRLTATTGQQVVVPITNISPGMVVSSNVQFDLNPSYESTIQCRYVPDAWIYADSLNSGEPGHTVAQDWRTNNWGVNGAVIFNSPVNPHSGSYCVQVSFNNYGGLQFYRGITVPFTQASGVTFWLRSDAPLANGLSFNIYDASSNSGNSMTISLTTTWTEYTFNFTTNAPKLNNVITLAWQSRISGSTPNIYIDDVNFILVAPSPSTASPSTAPSSNSPMNVVLNLVNVFSLCLLLLCLLCQ